MRRCSHPPHLATALRLPWAARMLMALLVLAMLLQGQSSVLVRLQGPSHRHAPAAPSAGADASPTWLVRLRQATAPLRQWRDGQQQRWLSALAAHPDRPVARPSESLEMAQPDVAASARTPHHHSALQRHRHDRHDPSVIPLERASDDATSDAPSQGSGGLAAMPLALAACWAWPARRLGPTAWTLPPGERWRDAALRQPDRPPQA